MKCHAVGRYFPKESKFYVCILKLLKKKQSEFTLPAPETIGCPIKFSINYSNTVIPRLTSDPANEDFFRCFSDSANEYGFG